ncbi:hypothetical protein [Algoriphagus sp. Y33]|uniref:hypothetical protein n=1 Tax=Algoriphagus sp. Y33 TaxID=2772483 RepID=UPI001786646C|nr:hypothetical protein [Algoriphagus sp. Y33]
MLEGITWKEYFAAVGILATVYYTVIAVMYYRKEIRALLSGRFRQPLEGKREAEQETAAREKDPFEELEAVVAELHGILGRAGKGAGKAMLLEQMRPVLSSYTGLREPAYRVAVTNFIITHAEELCGAVFSEEELEEEWRTLLRQ